MFFWDNLSCLSLFVSVTLAIWGKSWNSLLDWKYALFVFVAWSLRWHHSVHVGVRRVIFTMKLTSGTSFEVFSISAVFSSFHKQRTIKRKCGTNGFSLWWRSRTLCESSVRYASSSSVRECSRRRTSPSVWCSMLLCRMVVMTMCVLWVLLVLAPRWSLCRKISLCDFYPRVISLVRRSLVLWVLLVLAPRCCLTHVLFFDGPQKGQ